MDEKMKQESGDNSENVQIGGNVNIGVTAAEARQIAIDVFKANFYTFSEKAAKKALERAEELTDEFIAKFYVKIPELESKLQEPSVQSSMFNTQKEYAKSGDSELKEQLLNILIERINSEERSLKQIVLDEVLTILPKLTKEQINVMTLIFSAVYINHNTIVNIPTFIEFIENRILVFYPNTPPSYSFYTHLQFTGCCTILSEGSSYKPLEQIFKVRYKALISKGFTEEELNQEFRDDKNRLAPLLMKCFQNPIALQFNPLNDEVFNSKIDELDLGEIGKKALNFQNKNLLNDQEIKEFMIKCNPRIEKLLTDWKEKDFKTIRPTSVGLAIAIMNYNRVTKENIAFETFI